MAKPGAAAKQPSEERERNARGAARALRSVDGAATTGEQAKRGRRARTRPTDPRAHAARDRQRAGGRTTSLTFNDLKRLLQTTDGNLSVHARKLEDAKYIACTKSFEGRVPRTEYKLTTAGRRALERYLDHMEALIRATRER